MLISTLGHVRTPVVSSTKWKKAGTILGFKESFLCIFFPVYSLEASIVFIINNNKDIAIGVGSREKQD